MSSEIVSMLENALNYPCECGTPTGEMQGCKHCGLTEQAYRAIERLEAPYRLVDTPPTEPGWYVLHEFGCEPEIVEAVIRPGHKYLAVVTYDYGKRDFYAVKKFGDAKWGSAPLPIGRDKT